MWILHYDTAHRVQILCQRVTWYGSKNEKHLLFKASSIMFWKSYGEKKILCLDKNWKVVKTYCTSLKYLSLQWFISAPTSISVLLRFLFPKLDFFFLLCSFLIFILSFLIFILTMAVWKSLGSPTSPPETSDSSQPFLLTFISAVLLNFQHLASISNISAVTLLHSTPFLKSTVVCQCKKKKKSFFLQCWKVLSYL